MRLHSTVAGFYKIERVINAGSALEYKVPILDWFPNLILNTGLDRIGTNLSIYTQCIVGSNSATPTVNDLSIVSSLGSAGIYNYSAGNSGSPDYYQSATNVFRFNAGVATGNISEVGVGWGTSALQLFSRALILDSGGNPTTITKLADEVLDITYQFRAYPSILDATGTFTLTGNKGGTYDYTSRRSRIADVMYGGAGGPYPIRNSSNSTYMVAYSGIISSNLGEPTGGGSNSNNSSVVPYVQGSYEILFQSRFNLDEANFGVIPSVLLKLGSIQYQVGFSPAIPKTSSDILTLTAKVAWGRR